MSVSESHKIMKAFYLSPSYDPNAARPADVVQAAIEFALAPTTPATLQVPVPAGARERILQAMWDAHRSMLGHGPSSMPKSRQDSRKLYGVLLDAILALPVDGRAGVIEECARLRALVSRVDDVLIRVVETIEDEGDRAYLASTNDVDTLKDLLRETEAERYRIMEATGE
jgi:hypothetical protein